MTRQRRKETHQELTWISVCIFIKWFNWFQKNWRQLEAIESKLVLGWRTDLDENSRQWYWQLQHQSRKSWSFPGRLAAFWFPPNTRRFRDKSASVTLQVSRSYRMLCIPQSPIHIPTSLNCFTALLHCLFIWSISAGWSRGITPASGSPFSYEMAKLTSRRRDRMQ